MVYISVSQSVHVGEERDHLLRRKHIPLIKLVPTARLSLVAV